MDPVEAVSAIAVERKLPLHVDACVGGFLLPFVEKLGYPVLTLSLPLSLPPSLALALTTHSPLCCAVLWWCCVQVPKWDFRVAGVTSISVDLHKFGYTHKGASVLAWRHASDRKYQFWAFADW
jgi:sphinganine-1-phosphate aldolase